MVGEYIASRQFKESVRVASTANIADLNNAGSSIDGVTLTATNRVLLKDQSTASQNGIYIVSSTGPVVLSRANDFASSTFGGLYTNTLVFVNEGSAGSGKAYRLSTTGAITIGSTSLTFTEFGAGGGGGTWGSITGTLSSQTDLQSALDLKAPLASPTFTGTPAAPTASAGTNTTQVATTAFVTTADNLKANEQVTHNIQTGSNYTLVLTDADTKSILMRSLAAQTVTVPPVSSVAFPEGTMIILTQDTTGGLSVVAGSDVSIESSAGNLVSPGQDSPMVLEKKTASNSWILRNGTPPTTGAALTKVDDTNVTLTLGGTPSTALLQASSLTLGWTGTLSSARGGTAADNTTQTYTPTLTNTANVSASTARQCTYFRIGNAVTVSGQLDIDPTTTLTLTTLGISLPIASAFTTAFQLGGVGSASTVADGSAAILSDATNDRATFQYVCTDVTNHTMTFTFTYQVL